MNLYRVNLNLLVAFDALMIEQHVTRAGNRLALTQSAMSKILTQLRDLFKDELLVRVPGGMQPTQRALDLIEPVREVLRQAEAVISGEMDFDPLTLERTFRIGVSDYVATVLLPALMSRLNEQAPGVKLQIKHISALTTAEPFDAGKIDLAIGFVTQLPNRLYTQTLFHDEPVCAGWSGNPFFKKEFSFENYLEAEHIVFQFDEVATTLYGDKVLKDIGYNERKVKTLIPYATVGLLMLPNTPLLTTTGLKLINMFEQTLPLAYSYFPIELPKLPIQQVWHSTYHTDVPHRWLRSLIKEVAESL